MKLRTLRSVGSWLAALVFMGGTLAWGQCSSCDSCTNCNACASCGCACGDGCAGCCGSCGGAAGIRCAGACGAGIRGQGLGRGRNCGPGDECWDGTGNDLESSASGAGRLFGRGNGCGTQGNLLARRGGGTKIGLVGCNCAAGGCGCGAAMHCGMPAPNYPCPHPTPRPTTWTELTYPPMMPHNSLPNYRGTYSYRHGPGMSRTTVMWYPTKLQNALDRIHNMVEIPR